MDHFCKFLHRWYKYVHVCRNALYCTTLTLRSVPGQSNVSPRSVSGKSVLGKSQFSLSLWDYFVSRAEHKILCLINIQVGGKNAFICSCIFMQKTDSNPCFKIISQCYIMHCWFCYSDTHTLDSVNCQQSIVIHNLKVIIKIWKRVFKNL